MSFWIEKKQDGTLIVPLVALGDGIQGDGIIEVEEDDSEYQKYLKMYREEQGEIEKAEPAGKLTETGQAALEITENLERQIRQEWERLTANIAKGMATGAALSLYRRKAENLIRQGLADAWLTGRGEDLNEAEAKEIDKAVADQMDYLKGFMAEMEKGLSGATDKEEKGGILLANAARAVSYAGAAWSLYNVAKVFGAPAESMWAWSGPSGDGKICAGCQEEMDLGARPLSKMTRLPGSANCQVRCRHEIVRVK